MTAVPTVGTVTVVEAVPVVPLEWVTVTVYVPDTVTGMLWVLAPLLHWYELALVDCIVVPVQVMGDWLMLGVELNVVNDHVADHGELPLAFRPRARQ